MKKLMHQLGFDSAGNIAVNDAGSLAFTLSQDFIGAGAKARMCGWVYLWAKVDIESGKFDIVYVGKAGSTLGSRFKQHTNGFVNSPTGRKHAERIKTYFAAGDVHHQLHVYARKSPDVELLGEAGISMCEAEERAMITLCLRRKLGLWNYQTTMQRPRPSAGAVGPRQSQEHQPDYGAVENSEIGLPQVAEEGEGEQEGVLSREDAFVASIANNPVAKAIVAELLNALADRNDVKIGYTFTGGADLRVHYLARKGRPVVVARIWLQSKRGDRQGFGALLYLSPQEAFATGATEARERYHGHPDNVRSVAFFEFLGAAGAVVPTILRSIAAFEQDQWVQ